LRFRRSFAAVADLKTGLSREEAERRLREFGLNVVARDERHPHIQLLMKP